MSLKIEKKALLFAKKDYLIWTGYLLTKEETNPTDIYLFKVTNINTRRKCELCLKLMIKTPERRRSDVFIVNMEHILHLFLVFIFLTLIR